MFYSVHKANNYGIILRRFSTKDHCSNKSVACDLLLRCVSSFQTCPCKVEGPVGGLDGMAYDFIDTPQW
jgi:hypothetical protein